MLSYQHGYHAGNMADVVKHVALTRLLKYLTQKDKPLFYLETHSGRGRYDLHSALSLKTGEALAGITQLWQTARSLPSVFTPYLETIQQLNSHEHETVRYYPGSPAIALQMLRNQDRLFFAELHPGEFECLKQLPKEGKRVFYSKEDGLSALSARLPPPERRGLIFIDPSYEIKTDYRDIPIRINAAYHRFKTGVYCLWYPLIDNKLHQPLLRGMNMINATHYLNVEFQFCKQPGMIGCGLWIINPPYVLAEELTLCLKTLQNAFNPGVSSYAINTSIHPS